jgi:hypothetical protein
VEIFQIGIAEEQPTNEEIIKVAKVLEKHSFITNEEYNEIKLDAKSK